MDKNILVEVFSEADTFDVYLNVNVPSLSHSLSLSIFLSLSLSPSHEASSCSITISNVWMGSMPTQAMNIDLGCKHNLLGTKKKKKRKKKKKMRKMRKLCSKVSFDGNMIIIN